MDLHEEQACEKRQEMGIHTALWSVAIQEQIHFMRSNQIVLFFSVILLANFFPVEIIASDSEKAAAMRLGRMKAMSCAGCHGMDGKGIEREGKLVAPAYSDSAILNGDPEKLALIIMKGIRKESENYTGAMTAMEQIYDDSSLAAVITWVRNQWGGHKDYVSTDQVEEWRKKYADRTEPVSPSELSE